MTRAVLKNGLIHPLEPLPPGWRDGDILQVESAVDTNDAEATAVASIERDFQHLEALCRASDPLDDERLRTAIDESKAIAKDQMRRRMGSTP